MRLSQRLAKLERELPATERREMTDWDRFVTTDPWAVAELAAMRSRVAKKHPNGLPRKNGREAFLADDVDYLGTWLRVQERFTGETMAFDFPVEGMLSLGSGGLADISVVLAARSAAGLISGYGVAISCDVGELPMPAGLLDGELSLDGHRFAVEVENTSPGHLRLSRVGP